MLTRFRDCALRLPISELPLAAELYTMSQNQQISEAQIIKALEAHGCSWHDCFLVGEGDSSSICWFVPGSGMMALVIENNELARACRVFLIRNGAERLATNEDVKKRFAWDGKFRTARIDETRS